MKHRMFTALIPFAMVSAMAVADGEQAGPPEAEPGAILDYAWQVGHSKKARQQGNGWDDCTARKCIRAGDYIMLVRMPPRSPWNNNALLIIHSVNDGNVFAFESTYELTSPSGNASSITKVEVEFCDHLVSNCNPPTLNKRLTITPVRIQGSQVQRECNIELANLPGNVLKQDEIDKACDQKFDSVIHWEVETIIGTKGPPEDGQGTGSGGGHEIP